MKKLILATGNQGKAKEMKQMLEGKFDIVTMKEIGFDQEIIEDGKTFKENAEIKAKAIIKFAVEKVILNEGDLVMSEDAGFLVDAMPDELGVYSARFMGHDTGYDIKNAEIIKRLEGKPICERGCKYISDICIASIDEINHFTGEIVGYIAETPFGDCGFAFDPIFEIEKGKTMASITVEEKNAISHRGIAIRKLIQFLNK